MIDHAEAAAAAERIVKAVGRANTVQYADAQIVLAYLRRTAPRVVEATEILTFNVAQKVQPERGEK